MKTILIQLKTEDKATAQIKRTSKAVSTFGKKASIAMKKTSHGASEAMGKLDALGNRFRYMSIVVGALAIGAVTMMKSFVDAAKQGEQSFLKLGVFAISMGEDMDEVNRVANELAGTGLVSVSEAAESLAYFLATGLGLEKATDLLYTFLNAAAVGKESLTDTLGQALVKTAIGFKTFMERQIDASGIQAKLNIVLRKGAKEFGTISDKLTDLQRYQIMYNYYTEKGKRFTGAASIVQNTFSGSLARLSAQFFQMKIALGETLIPFIGTLSEVFIYVTEKITKFSKESSAMTSIVLVGGSALAILGAMVAMVGAMLPMLTSGFVVLNWAAIAPMLVMGLKVTAIFFAISVAIGGLTYLVLKATGQWDKWRDSISSLPERIKNTIKPLAQLGLGVAAIDEKIAKQIKNLERSITLATRDYLETMGKWAEKHDKTIKDLRKQIKDLERDYKSATDNIRRSFTDTMADLTLSHTRKKEDLKRDIDEEVSKGIWADQTRIRELRLALKRENEDYALSSKEKASDRDDDLNDEEEKLDDRLLKLKEELDKELELEKNNAALVAMARMQPFLDELKERTRAYEERMEQYQEELTEIKNTSSQGATALGAIPIALSKISDAANEPIAKIQEIKKETDSIKNAWTSVGDTMRFTIERSIIPILDYLSEKLIKIGEKIANITTKSRGIFGLNIFGGGVIKGSSIFDLIKSMLGIPMQEGGIVPGGINQPVPILAHGGETVLPVGASPITININNPSVREDQDIYRIADAVKQVISREQVLKHYK